MILIFFAAFWFWEQGEREWEGKGGWKERNTTGVTASSLLCLSTKKGSHERNISIISIISNQGKKRREKKERQENEPTGKLPLEHPDQDLGQVIDLQTPGISRSPHPANDNPLPFLASLAYMVALPALWFVFVAPFTWRHVSPAPVIVFAYVWLVAASSMW